MFDSINNGLQKIGLEPFTDREEVEAVIYIILRREYNGGGIFGRTSKLHVMQAILEFLIDTGTISETFAAATFKTWLEALAKAKK
jgi:hypothetical protein